jgi:hypothetical protein
MSKLNYWSWSDLMHAHKILQNNTPEPMPPTLPPAVDELIAQLQKKHPDLDPQMLTVPSGFKGAWYFRYRSFDAVDEPHRTVSSPIGALMHVTPTTPDSIGTERFWVRHDGSPKRERATRGSITGVWPQPNREGSYQFGPHGLIWASRDEAIRIRERIIQIDTFIYRNDHDRWSEAQVLFISVAQGTLCQLCNLLDGLRGAQAPLWRQT